MKYDPYVVIGGRYRDLVYIQTNHPEPRLLYNAAVESREQMDIETESGLFRKLSKHFRLDCGDVAYLHGKVVRKDGVDFVYPDIIYIRAGKENDLLQAYGINYKDQNGTPVVESLQQIIWNPHDHQIDLLGTTLRNSNGEHELRIRNGRLRDLHYTFCWMPGGDWRTASKQARTGKFEVCDTTQGPYSQKHIVPSNSPPPPPDDDDEDTSEIERINPDHCVEGAAYVGNDCHSGYFKDGIFNHPN